ncbi:MAG: TonB-dependent receptor [Bacteroidales bacterium]|nr:TonB-dependent receptor [Bacteroidales bacterium]
MNFLYLIAALLFLWFQNICHSQEEIRGYVYNLNKEPISNVNIYLKENPKTGTTSNARGFFKLKVNEKKDYFIILSHIEYGDTIVACFPGKTFEFILSKKTHQLPIITITEKIIEKENIEKINPLIIQQLPSIKENIESSLKTLPGVMKSNELSNQYSVRGGSFEENLIYVNGIEIIRPTLIRSGQQEGLSFINPDMISNIYFSAGGFDASYGDKMSSVLDIQYKKPTKNSITANFSLLGSGLTLEHSSKDYRLSAISSVRYKTTTYLLKSLDVKGQYQPKFYDIQTYLTYELSEKTEISFLGNFSNNSYIFIPQSREASFGTINNALKLKIYFEGNEKDIYSSKTAALCFTLKPTKKTKSQHIISFYNLTEKENFDILGQYFLNEVDKQLGSSTVGDSIENIGIGSFLNHARNKLNTHIYSYQNINTTKIDENKKIYTGLNCSFERVDGKIHEWTLIDSAGYSLPYCDTMVNVYYLFSGKNKFIQNKFSGFSNISGKILVDSSSLTYNVGARISFVTFSKELLISPRIQLSYRPHNQKNKIFRFATGYYYQPLTYKEALNREGKININLKSQKSVHFILGYENNFIKWNRPFKFIAEIYYKKYSNLIPYNVENIRAIYLGTNEANGFATGIDFKLHGEFIENTESWFSLSVMKTMENLYNDYNIKDNTEPSYIPRPNDQVVNFAIFFQDYLPLDPSYTFNLNLLFGTGLPFGAPKAERYECTFRMPPYRRVDVGLSKIVIDSHKKSKHIYLKYFTKLWIGIEIFNLLDINNTVSYQWVGDIYGNYYAVPNYLTSRRINLKIIMSL